MATQSTKELKFKVVIDALGEHEKKAKLTAEEVRKAGFDPVSAVERGFVVALDSEGEIVPLSELQENEVTAEGEIIYPEDTDKKVADLENDVALLDKEVERLGKVVESLTKKVDEMEKAGKRTAAQNAGNARTQNPPQTPSAPAAGAVTEPPANGGAS